MSRTDPTISIIVPVYNPGWYFPRCLASLEEQTIFPKVEIILVDDGSTDGSEALCDEFAARHPGQVQVFHQSNRGQGAARNIGLDAARGEYLQFVDSDDEIMPDSCETLLAYAETSGADIVWGDCIGYGMFKGAVAELAAQGPMEMWQFVRCALGSGLMNVSPCLQLLRASFVNGKGIRFAEGYIYEDQQWTLRLMLAGGTLLRVDFPFYLYNIGDHSSSSTVITAKRLMDAIDVVYAMIEDVESASLPSEVREVADAFVADTIAVLANSSIRYASKPAQALVRMRMNETFAHYAEQTQLLPMQRRTIGLAMVRDPELYEAELRRADRAKGKWQEKKTPDA